MKSTIYFLILLVSHLWLGSGVYLSAFLAPSLFAIILGTQAGIILGKLLPTYVAMHLICAVLITLLWGYLWKWRNQVLKNLWSGRRNHTVGSGGKLCPSILYAPEAAQFACGGPGGGIQWKFGVGGSTSRYVSTPT